MTVEQVRGMLLWSAIINYGFLILWDGLYLLARGLLNRVAHWWRLTPEQFDAFQFGGILQDGHLDVLHHPVHRPIHHPLSAARGQGARGEGGAVDRDRASRRRAQAANHRHGDGSAAQAAGPMSARCGNGAERALLRPLWRARMARVARCPLTDTNICL